MKIITIGNSHSAEDGYFCCHSGECPFLDDGMRCAMGWQVEFRGHAGPDCPGPGQYEVTLTKIGEVPPDE